MDSRSLVDFEYLGSTLILAFLARSSGYIFGPLDNPNRKVQLGKSNNNKGHVSNSYVENAADPGLWLAGHKTVVQACSSKLPSSARESQRLKSRREKSTVVCCTGLILADDLCLGGAFH